MTPVNIKIVQNPCSPIPYNEEIEEDKFCRTIGIYRVKYIELLSINLEIEFCKSKEHTLQISINIISYTPPSALLAMNI